MNVLIKITKCSKPSYWYKNAVGTYFAAIKKVHGTFVIPEGENEFIVEGTDAQTYTPISMSNDEFIRLINEV